MNKIFGQKKNATKEYVGFVGLYFLLFFFFFDKGQNLRKKRIYAICFCNQTKIFLLLLTSEELKTSGSKKLSKDHNSCKLFCSGVPVKRRRFWVLNSLTTSDS